MRSKKEGKFKMTRRQVLMAGMIGGAGLVLMPGGFIRRLAHADTAAPGLSDPLLQPKFVNLVPDALSPGFIYQPHEKKGKYEIDIGTAIQQTGLVDGSGNPLDTPIWGYGDHEDKIYTWPGRTFQVQSDNGKEKSDNGKEKSDHGKKKTEIKWKNKLKKVTQHLLPVDTNLHWCYSLPGYEQYTIAKEGVPIITHLHGGHTDWQFDGNPEFFYSPKKHVVGPQWANVPKGFSTKFKYDNDVRAGSLWYHDHALGITRLNVYAGLAGFYFVRDDLDTGLADNPLGLPAWPYEKAYAIQDRMFLDTGELFYPAYPGDPFYKDFITDQGAILPPDLFPDGGPTALAEFFGDHMVVNGLIWPYEAVEPRNYRLRLLNGCDSRFMVIQFVAVNAGETDFTNQGDPIPFSVIGSDQGLAAAASQVDTLVFEPGSRYDIVFDFKKLQGRRIIMKNIGGDAPFGGEFGDDLIPADFFPKRQTDRIMAFDVAKGLDVADGFQTVNIDNAGAYASSTIPVDRTRKVALFEGLDEFGRLQPLLGTAEPATDYQGNPINWPNTPPYIAANLTGQMEGAMAWHSPTTENPALGDTEIWEIYNNTVDAHPVHLHLVHFDVIDRRNFMADAIPQAVVMHNGELGKGYRLENIVLGGMVATPPEYVENAPKDMVTALPGQVTRIKATFDKPGRFVWHCHILSHEDHEMMRVMYVGPELASPPTNIFEGTLVVKEGHGDILVRAENGKQKRFEVEDDTIITRNGQPATFDDLRVGDQVRVLSDSDREVIELHATGLEPI